MSESVHENHELLVAYLYDECAPAERALVAGHLEQCAVCAGEMASLRETRAQLVGWAPPDVALGFQVTRPAATVLRPQRWWSQPLPAWAQAAAAVLIFGAGLSIGAVDLESDRPIADVAVSESPAPTSVTTPAWASTDDVARELAQVRVELAALRSAPPAAGGAGGVLGAAQAELLQEVQVLIAESERRQRAAFTLRQAELVRDLALERNIDWSRMAESVGKTEDEVRQFRDELRRTVATSIAR